MKSWITWDKRKQTSSMPWKKHGHTCKTNSLKKRTSNKKIYAKKKKRNKSVSMPAKHSMRQRCKRVAFPRCRYRTIAKYRQPTGTNWAGVVFHQKHATLIIEYQKDKRDLIEHIPTWKYQEEDLRKQLKKERDTLRAEVDTLQKEIDRIKIILQEAEGNIRHLQQNLDAYANIESFDWYKSHQDIFKNGPSMTTITQKVAWS